MAPILLVLYVAIVALSVRFLAGRSWHRAPRAMAILVMLSALPLAVLIRLSNGYSTEEAGWGVGLLLVTVVPANLLGAIIGLLWHRLRRQPS